MLPALDPKSLPVAVTEVCEQIHRAGFTAWLVGGCVRDSLLANRRGRGDASPATPGRWVAKDWDLASNATPQQIMGLFRKVLPTGVQHGTVTVLHRRTPIEVTTLRADTEYLDGRRPEGVHYVQSIEEDLARRDFTVNAIAYEPQSSHWVAPHGGLQDLEDGILRAVGEPSRRFAEDGLRVLRAARFVATLGFELDDTTAQAIRPSLASYRQVSVERIADEWNKALKAQRPSVAFEVMRDHGLLEITAPALHRALSAPSEQGVADTLRALDATEDRNQLRLAALCCRLDDEPARAAIAAEQLLNHLKYSNADRKQVARLVEHQALPVNLVPGPALRRWLAQVGPDLVEDLLSLGRALSSTGSSAWPSENATHQFAQAVEWQLETRPPLTVGDLAVRGQTLMQRLELKPGRHIGQLLASLVQVVLDDPEQNTEERLLAHCARRIPPPDSSPPGE